MQDSLVNAAQQLLAASAAINAGLDAIYAQFELTASAVEVLRILRSEPGGQPRGGIAQRLLSRSPDVTRLIDRLERRGLVKRVRIRSDRRLSVTRITAKGTELLAHVEPLVDDFRARLAPKLTAAEWKELGRLCERLTHDDSS